MEFSSVWKSADFGATAMRISQRLGRVKPSATLAVSAKAAELKSQGRDILSLSVGEPDFETPEHVREAAKKAVDEGFTRYTAVPGIPELRQAAAGYFNGFYGAGAESDDVIITNGGKQALYELLQALLDPGDKVLIPAPYWVSYPAMVLLADGEPVYVPAPADKGYKVTTRDLEAAYDPAVRVLLLNSPSNPTGVQYTRDELYDMARWAVDNGVFVISDEIYDRLVYPPAEPVSLSGLWKERPEMVAVVNGLSKSFAMTGWRVGFTLAHGDLIKAMSKIQGQSTSNVCSVAQKAALAALAGPYDLLERMREAYARRRDIAVEMVAGWDKAVCPRPDGAFYVFVDVSAYYREGMADSVEMCARLLEDAGVAAVPGAAFGDGNCIRFSYALSDDSLRDGLAAAGKVITGK
jgi:aspartate aminotransferase